jgi:hypothetical protein
VIYIPGYIKELAFKTIYSIIPAHLKPLPVQNKKATNIFVRGFFIFGAEGET